MSFQINAWSICSTAHFFLYPILMNYCLPFCCCFSVQFHELQYIHWFYLKIKLQSQHRSDVLCTLLLNNFGILEDLIIDVICVVGKWVCVCVCVFHVTAVAYGANQNLEAKKNEKKNIVPKSMYSLCGEWTHSNVYVHCTCESVLKHIFVDSFGSLWWPKCATYIECCEALEWKLRSIFKRC